MKIKVQTLAHVYSVQKRNGKLCGISETFGKVRLYCTSIREQRCVVLCCNTSVRYNRSQGVPKRRYVLYPPVWIRLINSEQDINRVFMSHGARAAYVQMISNKYCDFYVNLVRASKCTNVRGLVSNTIKILHIEFEMVPSDDYYLKLFTSIFKHAGVDHVVNKVIHVLH